MRGKERSRAWAWAWNRCCSPLAIWSSILALALLVSLPPPLPPHTHDPQSHYYRIGQPTEWQGKQDKGLHFAVQCKAGERGVSEDRRWPRRRVAALDPDPDPDPEMHRCIQPPQFRVFRLGLSSARACGTLEIILHLYISYLYLSLSFNFKI